MILNKITKALGFPKAFFYKLNLAKIFPAKIIPCILEISDSISSLATTDNLLLSAK